MNGTAILAQDPKKRKLSAVEQIRLEHEEAKRP